MPFQRHATACPAPHAGALVPAIAAQPGAGWCAARLALWLVAVVGAAGGAGAPARAADVDGLTGTWVGTTTAERLVFSSGGSFRTCFAPGARGNAALGKWRTVSPGLYTLEFTHAAAPDCRSEPKPLSPFKSTIVGQARLSKGELSLFVGGEFPPDVFRPAPAKGTR